MTRIFISYRRADSEGYVGRLYDQLKQYFDQNEIFLDVGDIRPGEDFVQRIEQVVGSCDALIAVIGPSWVNIRDKNGQRRLDKANDYVRLEIGTALKRNIPVIPTLVGRASMPEFADLPPDLASLTRRNAIELSHERFAFDVKRLVDALGGAFGYVIVTLGQNLFTLVRTRLMSPYACYDVLIDNNGSVRGRIEDTRFLDRSQTEKGNAWRPVKLRIQEGQHTIWVRYCPSKDISYGQDSNKLVFKLKGGQTLQFVIDSETDTIGKRKHTLRLNRPVIEI